MWIKYLAIATIKTLESLSVRDIALCVKIVPRTIYCHASINIVNAGFY